MDRTQSEYQTDEIIFSQGDSSDAIFYIAKGKIKLSAVSSRGKEAVLAVLGKGDFFGEACLAGQTKRMATASAMARSSVTRIEKFAALRLLHDEPAFAEALAGHVLARTIRVEEDLLNQLFNSRRKA